MNNFRQEDRAVSMEHGSSSGDSSRNFNNDGSLKTVNNPQFLNNNYRRSPPGSDNFKEDSFSNAECNKDDVNLSFRSSVTPFCFTLEEVPENCKKKIVENQNHEDFHEKFEKIKNSAYATRDESKNYTVFSGKNSCDLVHDLNFSPDSGFSTKEGPTDLSCNDSLKKKVQLESFVSNALLENQSDDRSTFSPINSETFQQILETSELFGFKITPKAVHVVYNFVINKFRCYLKEAVDTFYNRSTGSNSFTVYDLLSSLYHILPEGFSWNPQIKSDLLSDVVGAPISVDALLRDRVPLEPPRSIMRKYWLCTEGRVAEDTDSKVSKGENQALAISQLPVDQVSNIGWAGVPVLIPKTMKHILGKEHLLLVSNVKTILQYCLNSKSLMPPQCLYKMLDTLQCCNRLDQLLPYLCFLFSNAVYHTIIRTDKSNKTVSLREPSAPRRLFILLLYVGSIIMNPSVELTSYLHQIAGPLIFIIVSTDIADLELCRYSMNIRKIGAELLSSLIHRLEFKSFDCAFRLRKIVTTNMQLHLLHPNATLFSAYGALYTLRCLGKENLSSVLSPIMKSFVLSVLSCCQLSSLRLSLFSLHIKNWKKNRPSNLSFFLKKLYSDDSSFKLSNHHQLFKTEKGLALRVVLITELLSLLMGCIHDMFEDSQSVLTDSRNYSGLFEALNDISESVPEIMQPLISAAMHKHLQIDRQKLRNLPATKSCEEIFSSSTANPSITFDTKEKVHSLLKHHSKVNNKVECLNAYELLQTII